MNDFAILYTNNLCLSSCLGKHAWRAPWISSWNLPP